MCHSFNLMGFVHLWMLGTVEGMGVAFNHEDNTLGMKRSCRDEAEYEEDCGDGDMHIEF